MNHFGYINIVVPKIDTINDDTLTAAIINISFGTKSSFIVTGILSGPTPKIKEASYYITDDTDKIIFECSKSHKITTPELAEGDSIVLSLEYTI